MRSCRHGAAEVWRLWRYEGEVWRACRYGDLEIIQACRQGGLEAVEAVEGSRDSRKLWRWSKGLKGGRRARRSKDLEAGQK
jgi:hypothetical protein